MRCSATAASSHFVLAGIWRRSSARKGSSSVSSRTSPLRRNSISDDALDCGEQEVPVQLLDVEFGALAHTAPQNRAALLMDFEHVPFGFLARIPKDLLKN